MMQFIRLIVQEPLHAFYNMALDEAILEAVRQRRSPPTVRFYRWVRPSVSLGYFQSISDINIDYCSLKRYPLVRRLTGGRAIVHDRELTYSLISSSDSPLFRKNLLETYSIISNVLVHGLKLININASIALNRRKSANHRNPACFNMASYGEITIGKKKVIGSAQKRYKDGFLQHGSILLDFNAEELKNVLSCNDHDLSGICAIKDHRSDISHNDLISSIRKAIEKELMVKIISDSPSEFELNLARELEQRKYSTHAWNHKR